MITNKKDKTINIGSETAKTRETRILPISPKTAKHLQRLIDIAKANGGGGIEVMLR